MVSPSTAVRAQNTRSKTSVDTTLSASALLPCLRRLPTALGAELSRGRR